MNNDRDIFVRVQLRPTIPPFLAFAMLLSLPIGLGVAYQYLSLHLDLVVSFGLVPAIIWFCYGRQTRRNGHALRAFGITLLAPFLIQALFSGSQWLSYNTSFGGHYRHTLGQTCQYHVSDMKIGWTEDNYDYNKCESVLTSSMKTEICSAVRAKSSKLPRGFERCDARAG